MNDISTGKILRVISKTIDHSLLHPTLTDEAIVEGCNFARHAGVAAVCVKPYMVSTCFGILEGSDVRVCTVVGFPHGSNTVETKVHEAHQALRDGAIEIDMVVNIGKVLSGDQEYLRNEIAAVNDVVNSSNGLLKVIFENDFLADEHIVQLCEVCAEVQVAFAKTSTGFGFVKQSDGTYGYRGATDYHLQLMRRHLPPSVELKAAGMIRTIDDVIRVRGFGVSRVGATATAAILDEARRRGYA